MSNKILVPVLGESITEATVSKWLKKEGDTVEVGALLGSIGAKKAQKVEKEEKKYTPPPKKEEVTPKIFERPKEQKPKKVEKKLILEEIKQEPPLILSEEVKSDNYVEEKMNLKVNLIKNILL